MVYYWGFSFVCGVFVGFFGCFGVVFVVFVCLFVFGLCVCVVGVFFLASFLNNCIFPLLFPSHVIISIFLANFPFSSHEARHPSPCLTDFVPLPGIIFHKQILHHPPLRFGSCAARPALFAWRGPEPDLFLGSTLSGRLAQRRFPGLPLRTRAAPRLSLQRGASVWSLKSINVDVFQADRL